MRVMGFLTDWMGQYRQRADLSQFEGRVLEDAGLDREIIRSRRQHPAFWEQALAYLGAA